MPHISIMSLFYPNKRKSERHKELDIAGNSGLTLPDVVRCERSWFHLLAFVQMTQFTLMGLLNRCNLSSLKFAHYFKGYMEPSFREVHIKKIHWLQTKFQIKNIVTN